MTVEVKHPTYGKTELNVERIIAICPEKKLVLFEDVYWPLSEEDFNKVADAWRETFSEELKFNDNVLRDYRAHFLGS